MFLNKGDSSNGDARLRERLIENVMDFGPAVVYVTDLDGRFIAVNAKFASLFDLPQDKIVGRPREDFMPREIASQHRENDLKVIEGGEALTFGEDNEERAGMRHYMTNKVPLKDDAGKIVGVVGISLDVTERKRIEEELALERDFLKAIFDSAPGMLYLYDTEGKLVRWNGRHESMTGYTSEELSRMTLEKWYEGDAESFAAVQKGLERTMSEGFGEAEANLRTKDGRRIPMYFTASPLTIRGKQYFTGIGIDVTDRKRIETEKQRLQEQLLQSQKMESVGRLAGGIAHDFNNMLGVIIGYADLAMAKVSPSEPVFSDLQEIANAARRSAELTRQLLAFARKQTIAPESLDLNETIGGMLKMLRYIIGENIRLDWHPTPGIERVKLDPTQLNQILANLCVNARDAISGEGTITIETGKVSFDAEYCSAHADFLPGDFVMLAVSDDGCGMTHETMGKIFEPFFTTKEMGHGTGLGLSTVYGIVRQNGGFINVYSEIGNGTTFKIYIPPFGGDAEETVAERHSVEGTPVSGTILLVEDEPPLLAMTKTMLERIGYRVLAANGGKEALDEASDYPGHIDLLITDVIMPGMNGRELADRLSQLYPGIRTLYMSGYTATFIAGKGVLDGDTNFIQKPFTADDLALKTREALGGKKTRQED